MTNLIVALTVTLTTNFVVIEKQDLGLQYKTLKLEIIKTNTHAQLTYMDKVTKVLLHESGPAVGQLVCETNRYTFFNNQHFTVTNSIYVH